MDFFLEKKKAALISKIYIAKENSGAWEKSMFPHKSDHVLDWVALLSFVEFWKELWVWGLRMEIMSLPFPWRNQQ